MIALVRSVVVLAGIWACSSPASHPADSSADAPIFNGSDTAGPYLYATALETLFRFDPDTLAISTVGAFTPRNDITDIAIDRDGHMMGIGIGGVYRIDPVNAAIDRLSGRSQYFQGLSYVPAAMLGGSGDDVLVATGSDGRVFELDPATGSATQIGDMGSGFTGDGDLVAIAGLGIFATGSGSGSSGDQLARLTGPTFAATAVGAGTGFSDVWGLAFSKNELYGFTRAGEMLTIDPTTGAATLRFGHSFGFWGGAVTTIAPVTP